jgi:hypothetical protein
MDDVVVAEGAQHSQFPSDVFVRVSVPSVHSLERHWQSKVHRSEDFAVGAAADRTNVMQVFVAHVKVVRVLLYQLLYQIYLC